jgi:hypothetical protein
MILSVQGGGHILVQNRDIEAQALEYLRTWLPECLLDRLFQMTQAITKHVLVGAAAPEAQFPQLPGSHLTAEQLGTPALAFVRTVCHVLALDTSIEDEVRCKLPAAKWLLARTLLLPGHICQSPFSQHACA